MAAHVILVNVHPTPLLIINTYMPTLGSAVDYGEVLAEVHEVMARYRELRGQLLLILQCLAYVTEYDNHT